MPSYSAGIHPQAVTVTVKILILSKFAIAFVAYLSTNMNEFQSGIMKEWIKLRQL